MEENLLDCNVLEHVHNVHTTNTNGTNHFDDQPAGLTAPASGSTSAQFVHLPVPLPSFSLFAGLF